MKKFKCKAKRDLLPFHIIKAASEGDIIAINYVLEYYTAYIVSLSTRRFINESIGPHYCVDETLKQRLEIKLITKILDFKIA